MVIEVLGLIGVTSIIEAVALYFIKKNNLVDLPIAMILYGLGVVPLLYYTSVSHGIGMINFIWNIVSTIFGFIIGIYLFKEKVNNLQLIGVLLSLTGIGLIMISPDSKDK
jgi:multidrug transporter EmrE-like cation transporter